MNLELNPPVPAKLLPVTDTDRIRPAVVLADG